MKKFIFLLVIVGFLQAQKAQAQIVMVADAVAQTVLEKTNGEQLLHYAWQVEEQIKNFVQFTATVTALERQIQQTVQTLKSAKDITNFKDFMDWYNRSLYMERRTLDTLNNLDIKIGKKSYHFTDIENMAYGMKDTYIDYWDREFTNEQRKEMWLGLGLTPANYAYVEPFRDEMREWRRQGFAAEYIQNSSYMEAMQRNRERKERLVGDIDLGEEDKMGEKEVAMLNLETNMDNNKVLHDIAMYHAMSLKRDSLQMYLDDAPHDEQPITEWPADGFRPLKKK